MSTVMHAAASGLDKTASVRYLPVSLFGAVMGLAGLALAWRHAHKWIGVPVVIADGVGIVAIVVFVALALGYLVKLVRYRVAVLSEFNHPVAGNFFGTIAIAILLLSVLLGRYSESLQQLVWSLGVIATLLLGFIVLGRVLRGGTEHANVVPVLIIPGVASLDIPVTGGTMPMAWAHEINVFSVAIGTMIALVFFTMIFSRLMRGAPLANGMVPSLMILIAPFEVGFLAYVNMTQQIDMLAGMLFYAGLFLFIVLSFKVFRREIAFSPSWWAISFPIAALSNAALRYAEFVGGRPLAWLAIVILAFVTVAIAILFVRTLHWFASGKLVAG